jgi:mono/diheme cytochrome c family protein
MRMLRTTRLAPLLSLGVLLGSPAGAEEPSAAATLFAKKCSSCHTLGEGDRQGPDLLGVTKRRDAAWLRDFIRTPGALIDSGDKVANELLARFNNVRMPEQPLTDAELKDLFAYLDDCAAKGGCKVALGKVKHAKEATDVEVEAGRRLFEGSRPFAKGGASCISCHDVRGIGLVGGGTLARDLTHAYARLGDGALSAALENTPFPIMKDIYAKRALTESERFQVKAFLARVARDGTPASRDHNFLYLGAVGLLLALGAIGLFWAGRMKGVRSIIVKRGEP